MIVFLDLAWRYRPEPGHLRTGQLCKCGRVLNILLYGFLREQEAPAMTVSPIFALEAPPLLAGAREARVDAAASLAILRWST